MNVWSSANRAFTATGISAWKIRGGWRTSRSRPRPTGRTQSEEFESIYF